MKPNVTYLKKAFSFLLFVTLVTFQAPSASAATQTKVLTIYFNSKSASVSFSNYAKLSEVVDQINSANGRNITVTITGYTRSKGATTLDKKYLSSRVNNVVAELEELGLVARITKNLNGKVNTTGSQARKVVVNFRWDSGVMPSPSPTPTVTTPIAAPLNLVVAPLDRALSISFTTPTLLPGQADITGYEYQLNADGIWRSSLSSTPLIQITGLTNNTLYSIQVRAVNTAGKGVTSTAISGTPVNTIPNAPTNLSVVAGFGQLTINFTPGFNGGSPITNYEYTLNGGSTWNLFSPNLVSSPAVITGLSGGIIYSQIKLRAVNANGRSSDSVMVSGTPLVAAPSVPTNLSVAPGDGQLTISFTPASSNGSPILRYEYSLDGGTNFIQFPVNYLNSPVIISGLTNRALYTSIKLRAVNSVGAGAASASVSGTPSRVPTAPTITSVVAGNQSLTVSFTAGNDFGVSVSNYQYSIDGGTTWKTISPSDAISPIVITGLTNGVTYSALRLRAVNSIGTGDRSELFSGTPAAPATAPSAPIVISLLPGNQKVALALSSSVSNGGSDLIRYEYSLNGGASWSSLALPISGNTIEITGLTNATSYTQVRLRSVNAVGTSQITAVPSFTPSP